MVKFMRSAKDVKTPGARATIAAQLIKADRTRERAFDDCFEMYDGDEVAKILLERAQDDSELMAAIKGNAAFLLKS